MHRWYRQYSEDSPVDVVVSTTNSVNSTLTFRNFSVRCDKANPKISFKVPWDLELVVGKKVAVISNNSFLRYQLISAIADLVPPVSGEVISNGVIGWPVGGEAGLDSKLRISHALNFLSAVYGDCLEQSLISVDEFWGLLAGVEIVPDLIITDLSKSQKDFFFLALSVLFRFDCYLIPKTRYLMSNDAEVLRDLLHEQLENKTLVSSSTNSRFQREFCTDGLVLGPQGQILFAGGLTEAIQWADHNLLASDVSDSEDEQFELAANLKNSESGDDISDSEIF